MADLYRTKADYHVFEADRLTSANTESLSVWCDGVFVEEHDALKHEITFAAINVPTPDGMERAQEGDWLVKSATGNFYIVKHDKFKHIFEVMIDS